MVSVSGDLELVFVFSVLLLVGVMSMVELKHLIKSLKEEEIKKKTEVILRRKVLSRSC